MHISLTPQKQLTPFLHVFCALNDLFRYAHSFIPFQISFIEIEPDLFFRHREMKKSAPSGAPFPSLFLFLQLRLQEVPQGPHPLRRRVGAFPERLHGFRRLILFPAYLGQGER
jgi:hypothetical protein